MHTSLLQSVWNNFISKHFFNSVMEELFPHEKVRPVQKAFMKQVEAAIKNKQHLLAHCPTGLGKTAAVLSPALEYALKNNKTVLFLTSRHMQHMIAVETLLKVKQKHNTKLNVVDLVGKKWMCCQQGVTLLNSSEFSDFCKDLREKGKCDFFNNLKRKGKLSFETQRVLSELRKEPRHMEKLKQLCSDLRLCSFEVACILAKEAHVIIADYYHFLQPSIRTNLLKRMNKNLDDCIIIMDEGHNLPGRARKLLTQSMSTFMLESAAKEARKVEYNATADALTSLKSTIEKMASTLSIEKHERLMKKKELLDAVGGLIDYDELCSDLHFVAEEIIETKKRSFAGSVANFLESWPGPDKSFIRILSRVFGRTKPYLNIAYKCLDPSIALKDIISDAHSIILMSGTLTPTEMYRDLLGFGSDAHCAEYINPFPHENRLNLVVPKTSTKFTVRGAGMYRLIARECALITNNVPGNCAVFFPSYKLRDEVNESLRAICNKTTFLEEPGMTKEGKAELIEEFKSYSKVGAVLLAVSSGSFGEGIDLVGDFLKCVVVVGLPLKKPDLETEALIKYYDEKYGKGWDYGYVMPAIITTMQNAGRCIRSATDKGIIVFLDERYIWKRYFNCFPKDWNMKVALDVQREIKKFYHLI